MEEKVEKKQKKWIKILCNILFVFLIAICGLIIFFNVTHEYYDVLGPSMSPTINVGVTGEHEKKDGVFVSKIKSYTRGDIIVALRTNEKNETYHIIKRIIAIGGDKIKIDEIDGVNKVVIIKAGMQESEILNETYIKDYSINKNLKKEFYDMINREEIEIDENGFMTIPNEHIFYLGDNRLQSSDCADYGPVQQSKVVGKVDYIIYNNTNPYGQVIGQIFGW